MNEKTLNSRELAQIKRIAQNVDADVQKVYKLNAKIRELLDERNSIQKDIDEMEAPVMRKTGGYRSTEIYEKVVTPQFNLDGTPKTDKDGRQIKITKYVLKYENGVLPVKTSNPSPYEMERPSEESVPSDNDELTPVIPPLN